MFRFRLRTLLIAVALGPPAMAVAWMAAAGMRVHPVLLDAAFYGSPCCQGGTAACNR